MLFFVVYIAAYHTLVGSNLRSSLLIGPWTCFFSNRGMTPISIIRKTEIPGSYMDNQTEKGKTADLQQIEHQTSSSQHGRLTPTHTRYKF
jgi:hypothetical protein